MQFYYFQETHRILLHIKLTEISGNGTGVVGPAPALGLPDGLFVIIIARCTMLLTGAPLELNHVETQHNCHGTTHLVEDE